MVLVVDDKNVAHDEGVQVGVREPEMVQVLSAGVEASAGERVVTVGRPRARGQGQGADHEAGRESAGRDETKTTKADEDKK